ncbi:MAG: PD-(D/E)XK nuclease family protein [Actinomycetaceae bacterium]|nr:PD-(D/E)XK nuclease family protein [Actinomycetaceae bacterium]
MEEQGINSAPHDTSIRLRLGAQAATLPPLDARQQSIVKAIIDPSAHGSGRHAIILGCPGSGRTLTALMLAHELHKRNPTPVDNPVLILAADRLRVDLVQPFAEQLLPGVVRPVRTPVALAFDYTSAWNCEREQPRLAPQLLTGAQEDAELADIIRGRQIEWPEWITEDVTALPAFRMELRNLLARAREAGWDADMLRLMGERSGREMWQAGADLMEVWDSSPVALGAADRPALLSAPQLQEQAGNLIRQWNDRATTEDVHAPLTVPYAVVVDDLHDCTGATLTLLSALAEAGSRIIATADPDVAVATYRGGEPHLDGRLQRALDASVYELGPTYRGSLALRRVVQGITNRITVTGSAKRRSFGAVDAREDTAGLAVRVYGSRSQEITAIAHEIRRRQLSREQFSLSDMAVIVRSSSEVNRVRFALMRHGIETTSLRRAINYAGEPVTSTLLALLVDHAEETPSTLFRTLMASPYVGVNLLELHRLIAACAPDIQTTSLSEFASQLRDRWKNLDGSDELRERITQQALDPCVRGLVAALDLIEVGRTAAGDDPQRALWSLWEAAGVETAWVRAALVNEAESALYDERLDAVISLMRTADVWQQRNPGGTAREFAAELRAETLPTDNLAIGGQRPTGVHVLTAAQSVGKQWPIVFVSGVQDGSWPNLTLRDRLSRAGEITEVANGSLDVSDLARGGNTMMAMRRSALNEELRMFAAAVSRARQYLTVTACRTEDLAPSSFVDLCATLMGMDIDESGGVPTTQVPPGVDTRSLIARLRYILTAPHQAPEHQRLAGELLALMANEGMREADPMTWSGVGGMTAVGPTDDRPRLSPSAIEVLLTCPARWFMTKHGGDVPSGDASTIGTLVHDIAEEFPHGDPQTLLNELDERWDDNEFDRTSSLGQKFYAETREKVQRMGEYFQHLGPDCEVETEYGVRVELDNAIITGKIDRIESVDGGVRITDIKTGRPGSQKGTETHLQLLLYQYALNRLGFNVQGARLLALAHKSPEKFNQSSIFSGSDSANERLAMVEETIAQAATLAQGPEYAAIITTECRTCPVVHLCPARDEGLRAIE